MLHEYPLHELVEELDKRRFSETLPLVKEWLAGEGYAMISTSVVDCGDIGCRCSEDCDAFCWGEYGDSENPMCRAGGNFSIGEYKGNDGYDHYDYTPDPSKCPAMLKAAKEARDVQHS